MDKRIIEGLTELDEATGLVKVHADKGRTGNVAVDALLDAIGASEELIRVSSDEIGNLTDAIARHMEALEKHHDTLRTLGYVIAEKK